MFCEIYKQSDMQIKAEYLYENGDSYLVHWFKLSDNRILKQRYKQMEDKWYGKWKI